MASPMLRSRSRWALRLLPFVSACPACAPILIAAGTRSPFSTPYTRLYIKNNAGEPSSLEADTLKIPLDRTIVPEIFPAVDDSLASYDKFILVDIGKGFLALYAQGELQRVFPISGGTPEKATPLIDFKIAKKYEEHWSNIYDTWMPWALLIKRPYYIHGGALPGRSDSAGCIRLFPHDAEELYHLVEVGTPGRIIETSQLELTYPAFFCR